MVIPPPPIVVAPGLSSGVLASRPRFRAGSLNLPVVPVSEYHNPNNRGGGGGGDLIVLIIIYLQSPCK